MFDEFFRDNSPADIEELSDKRKSDIKAAVMKRVSQESEEKNMKKHNFFRPLLIAAAAVSVSAVSLVTANAATNGAVVDGITKMFTIIVNGEEYTVEAKYSEYDEDGMHIEQYEMEVPGSNGDDMTIGYSFIFSGDGEEGIDPDILDDLDISDYLDVTVLSDEEVDMTEFSEENFEFDMTAFSEEDFKEYIEKYGVDLFQFETAEGVTVYAPASFLH